MNTLKANNFNQALKEMKALDQDQAGKLKEAINHSDRKHYHVIRINITTVEGEARNKVGFNISKHHPNGFEKLKNNFKMMGINRLIVLHDPTQLDEKEEPTVPPHQKESIEAKVRREMKEQHDAEIDQKVKEGIVQALKEKEEAEKGNEDPTPEEILEKGFEAIMKKNATVEAIDAFAKDYVIDFGEEVKNKADKQEVIKDWKTKEV